MLMWGSGLLAGLARRRSLRARIHPGLCRILALVAVADSRTQGLSTARGVDPDILMKCGHALVSRFAERFFTHEIRMMLEISLQIADPC